MSHQNGLSRKDEDGVEAKHTELRDSGSHPFKANTDWSLPLQTTRRENSRLGAKRYGVGSSGWQNEESDLAWGVFSGLRVAAS